MHRLTNHKTLLASLTLLVFLFSANALCFGSHAVEEMLQAADQVANASLEEPRAISFSHHHHPGAADDKGHDGSGSDSYCCDTQHNHDLAGASTASVSALNFSTLPFIEPFAWLPEVFLDRFIPPQNLS